MPARLTKPTDVADNHGQLIDMLWRFYIAAHEPPMRKIADAIKKLDEDEQTSTANHETVRKTLSAITLPQQETVEVMMALIEIPQVCSAKFPT